MPLGPRENSAESEDHNLVLDSQICPERPSDDLGLGGALLLGPLVERPSLVLVDVAHLTDEVRPGKPLALFRSLVPVPHVLRGYLMSRLTLDLN